MNAKACFTPLGLGCSVPRPLGRFARSIEADDDHTALRLAAQHPDQQLGWTHLADACTRRIWLHQGRPLFGQLMAIPVIHDDLWPLDGPPTLDGSACQAMTTAVNGCLKDACALLLFSRLRNYACVSSWSPLILAEHLNCVHDRQLLAPLYEEKRGLLARSTQLSFLFTVIVSRRSWPAPPTNGTGALSQLDAVVRDALATTDHRRPSPLQILPLRPIQDAIASGLCAWIAHVHAEGPIRNWRVEPIREPSDMVRVDVEASPQHGWAAGFNVRKHQVGLRGLQSVTYALNECIKPGDPAISNT